MARVWTVIGWLWCGLASILLIGAAVQKLYAAAIFLGFSALFSMPVLRSTWERMRIGGAIRLGGASLAALFGALALGTDRAPDLENSRNYVTAITVAGYHSPILNVQMDIGTGARDAAVLVRAGEATRRLAMDLESGKLVEGKVEKINATFLGPPSGESAVGRKVLHLTFDAAKLSDGLAQGLDGAQLMATAHDGGHWTPANDDIFRAYCDADRLHEEICTRF